MSTPTLELRNLEVSYTVRGIDREVLRNISLSIQPGEAYGLVGESGCGKSTAAYAAMRYLPRNGKITSGSILFDGADDYVNITHNSAFNFGSGAFTISLVISSNQLETFTAYIKKGGPVE